MSDQVLQVLPNTPSSVLALMPASQAQVDKFSDELIRAVKDGEMNPLQLRATLKATEMVIARVNKETQWEQLTEADKYPERTFEAFGCKIEKAELGTSYDYESCGDPVYAHRLKIQEEATKQVKEREAWLKAVKEPMNFIVEDTGEVVKITPPIKKSTSGLKISVK